MKPRTNGVSRSQKSNGVQSEGPNWVIIAGSALLSTLSVRLGYKLKQVLDSRQPNKTTSSLKGNEKSSDGIKSGNGHMQSFDQTAGNNVNSLSSNRGILKHSVEDSYMSYPGKRQLSDAADRSRMLPLNDSMDVSWSHEEKDPSTVHLETNGGPRWRSDDTSEDEEIPSPAVFTGVVSPAHTSRGVRRSRRLARR